MWVLRAAKALQAELPPLEELPEAIRRADALHQVRFQALF